MDHNQNFFVWWFVFAVLISLATAKPVAPLVVSQPERAQYPLSSSPEIDTVDDPRLQKYQTPSDAEFCKEWIRISPVLGVASFTLPVSSNLTFFTSRGGQTQGKLRMFLGEQYADHISVRITANLAEPGHLDAAKVCRAGNSLLGENGIMLWAAEALERSNFRISVEIPANGSHFNDLTVDFGSGAYGIAVITGSLWRVMSFGKQRYRTNDARIDLLGWIVSRGTYLLTSNAPITAWFLVSGNTTMHTSNASILTFIFPSTGWPGGAMSTLGLHTSNGPIWTTTSFGCDKPNSVLDLDVSTSDDEVMIILEDDRSHGSHNSIAPTYLIDVSTSNAAASLVLPGKYEGDFHIQTAGSSTQARVILDDRVQDPYGKGRNRSVEIDDFNDHWVKGRMLWGNSSTEKLGKASLRTTGGDVMCCFGQCRTWMPSVSIAMDEMLPSYTAHILASWISALSTWEDPLPWRLGAEFA